MQNDIELLSLAAKAAGIELQCSRVIGQSPRKSSCWSVWNPGQDDGDCARMEAAIGIDIEWQHIGVIARKLEHRIDKKDVIVREAYGHHEGDRNAARRAASLKVAAEIGRSME